MMKHQAEEQICTERERSGCGYMVAWVQVLQRERRDNSVSAMWHI